MEKGRHYEALAHMIFFRGDGESLLLQFAQYREGKSFEDIEQIRAGLNGGGLEAAARELHEVVEIATFLGEYAYARRLYEVALS